VTGAASTFVTRREIFDYLRTCGFPWFGQLDELVS
jgi:AbiJ N-terminal domain 3